MRRLSGLAIPALAAALLCGCASRTPSPKTIGLIPLAARAADLRDDNIRRLGVDRAPKVPLDQPIYMIPVSAVGAGFNVILVEPFDFFYKKFAGDNAAAAAHDILDASPDKRRHGILRLAEESYAREGQAETDLWADIAEHDKDYTVRAAGIRALNWARDSRHTQVFLDGLVDDRPLVRLEAAKALANVPDPRATTPLTERLQRDISHDVRIAAADALRCYKTDEVAHSLIAVLTDSDFAVAWQARQSLRLMTAHDFQYDERAWLGFVSESKNPFE